MGKIYLKAPGHFVFIEQINRNREPEKERKRLEAMVMMAIDKYFNYKDNGNRSEKEL